MTRFTTLASVAVVTLLLATGAASALEAIGGLNESIAPTAEDSIQDAVQTPSTEQSIQDAVQFDPDGHLQDAVLDGAHPNKGGKVTINGRALQLAFTCTVGENDLLVLRNAGADVPAGTKVRWDVRAVRERGVVRLPSGLANGETVRVDTGAAIDAGLGCKAQAI